MVRRYVASVAKKESSNNVHNGICRERRQFVAEILHLVTSKFREMSFGFLGVNLKISLKRLSSLNKFGGLRDCMSRYTPR
jgi:hypothetical protein